MSAPPITAVRSLPLAAHALVALVALGACTSSPPVRYYSLVEAGQAVAPTAVSRPGPSFVVGPVNVPAALERAQIVRLTDGTRTEVASGHRWVAPLKAEIAARIAGEIARSTGIERVVAWPQSVFAVPDLTAPIDIQRLDTIGFESVSMEAVWSLKRHGVEIASGRFAATEPIPHEDYAAVAAAHARLATALARVIADGAPPTWRRDRDDERR